MDCDKIMVLSRFALSPPTVRAYIIGRMSASALRAHAQPTGTIDSIATLRGSIAVGRATPLTTHVIRSPSPFRFVPLSAFRFPLLLHYTARPSPAAPTPYFCSPSPIPGEPRVSHSVRVAPLHVLDATGLAELSRALRDRCSEAAPRGQALDNVKPCAKRLLEACIVCDKAWIPMGQGRVLAQSFLFVCSCAIAHQRELVSACLRKAGRQTLLNCRRWIGRGSHMLS